ncbi:hypothetical protein F2P79_012590 [Pimephales promelas]|nr:hypothetical protein F2P79_012590 [Pimephales promelas]
MNAFRHNTASLLVFVLLSCFSLIDGKSLGADETCVGMQRDHSYDFDLPNAVTLNVQNDESCDAEWTIDKNFIAILDGSIGSIHFSLPFKKVTRQGISVDYCPVSIQYHVSCSKYTKNINCYCTNSTDNKTVFETSLPPTARDTLSSGSTKRQHYCAIAVAAAFVISFVILAFSICRTNCSVKYASARTSADEQNQPG